MTKVDRKIQECLKHSEKTSKMVKECTDVPLQLAKCSRSSSARLFNLEKIEVDASLKDLRNEACMSFKLKWQIYCGDKTGKSREGTAEIQLCFNGEFMRQLAENILHQSFPELKSMEKILSLTAAR